MSEVREGIAKRALLNNMTHSELVSYVNQLEHTTFLERLLAQRMVDGNREPEQRKRIV